MALPQPYPPFRAWDDNGEPLVGGKVYSYEAGTSTEKTTFSDYALTTPNSNPVILDSNGEAYIFLGPGSTKLALFDADDNPLWTVDNLGPGAETGANEFNVDSNGAVADGITDCTEAFNDTITAAYGAGGGTIVGSAGTYRIDTDFVDIPNKINFKFAGVDRTIFDCRGSSTPFIGSEGWWHQRFEGFTITHANNTGGSNLAMFDARKGANSCWFDFRLVGKGEGTVTQHGLVIRAGYGGVANLTPTDNHIYVRTTKSGTTACAGKAVYLWGDDTLPNRCNANFVYGILDGFDTGVFVCGAENYIAPGINAAATAGIHIEGNASVRNVINARLDQGGDTCKIKLVNTAAASRPHMATIIESVNDIANIVASGTTYAPNYTWVADTIYVGDQRLTVGAFNQLTSPVIPGPDDDTHHMMLWGSRHEDSGKIILAGKDYDGSETPNLLGSSSSISAMILDTAGSQFMVTKKDAGANTGTELFTVPVTMPTGASFGFRIGTATTNRWMLFGTTDPTGGGGVDVAIGSLYSHTTTGQLYSKTGAGATNWTANH